MRVEERLRVEEPAQPGGLWSVCGLRSRRSRRLETRRDHPTGLRIVCGLRSRRSRRLETRRLHPGGLWSVCGLRSRRSRRLETRRLHPGRVVDQLRVEEPAQRWINCGLRSRRSRRLETRRDPSSRRCRAMGPPKWRPIAWCTDPVACRSDGHRVILRENSLHPSRKDPDDDRRTQISTLPVSSKSTSRKRPRICCGRCSPRSSTRCCPPMRTRYAAPRMAPSARIERIVATATGTVTSTPVPGTVDVAIPKLRQGSYFPEWLLERRRRAEAALTTVVATSYLLGVSTRRMEDLVQSLGITGLSKSQVSEMAKDLDEQVRAVPHQAVGRRPVHVRRRGRAHDEGPRGRPGDQGRRALATGVNAEGYREILGMQVSSTRGRRRLAHVLPRPVARGLTGVKLVTCDAHQGWSRRPARPCPARAGRDAGPITPRT